MSTDLDVRTSQVTRVADAFGFAVLSSSYSAEFTRYTDFVLLDLIFQLINVDNMHTFSSSFYSERQYVDVLSIHLSVLYNK